MHQKEYANTPFAVV